MRVGQFVYQDQTKIIHTKFPRNFSPTFLACMSRELMAEINVCKTITQKIYVVFYDMKCSKCSDM